MHKPFAVHNSVVGRFLYGFADLSIHFGVFMLHFVEYSSHGRVVSLSGPS